MPDSTPVGRLADLLRSLDTVSVTPAQLAGAYRLGADILASEDPEPKRDLRALTQRALRFGAARILEEEAMLVEETAKRTTKHDK